MKYIPIKICLVIIALFVGVAAASDLPDCPSDRSKWNNCFGTKNMKGAKYAGSFKNNQMNGPGTFGNSKYHYERSNNR